MVENDCNLAVIAERWCGAARGLDDVVCVLAGERIGAGIMVGGKLMRGHEGAAGELAFLGAFEVEHGARGIAQLVRELSGSAPEAVFIAAGAGDEEALEIVERAERWAGHGIVTDGPARQPRGRRDRRRRGAGGRGPARAAAGAAGGDGPAAAAAGGLAAGRAGPLLGAVRLRWTNSSRGCSPDLEEAA